MSKDIAGIKDGDYVRVVLEGAAVVADRAITVGKVGDNRNVVLPRAEHVVSIEKIDPPAPPVEYFKPGDRIRRIDFRIDYEATLGDYGYFLHHGNGSSYHPRELGYIADSNFHSGDYELVYRNGESK